MLSPSTGLRIPPLGDHLIELARLAPTDALRQDLEEGAFVHSEAPTRLPKDWNSFEEEPSLEEIGMAIMRGDQSRALDYLEKIFAGELSVLNEDLIHVAANALVPGRREERSDKERTLAIDCLCSNPDGSLKGISDPTFFRVVEIAVQEQPKDHPDELTPVSLHIQNLVCRLVASNGYIRQYIDLLSNPKHPDSIRRSLGALIRPALSNPTVALRLAEELGSGPNESIEHELRLAAERERNDFSRLKHQINYDSSESALQWFEENTPVTYHVTKLMCQVQESQWGSGVTVTVNGRSRLRGIASVAGQELTIELLRAFKVDKFFSHLRFAIPSNGTERDDQG